jgi:hypothetical protein
MECDLPLTVLAGVHWLLWSLMPPEQGAPAIHVHVQVVWFKPLLWGCSCLLRSLQGPVPHTCARAGCEVATSYETSSSTSFASCYAQCKATAGATFVDFYTGAPAVININMAPTCV